MLGQRFRHIIGVQLRSYHTMQRGQKHARCLEFFRGQVLHDGGDQADHLIMDRARALRAFRRDLEELLAAIIRIGRARQPPAIYQCLNEYAGRL